MNRNKTSEVLSAFFFAPISPYPLAIFRILFALCVLFTLALLHSDWLAWFGVRGWVSMDTIGKAESGFRFNLFALIPRDDSWVTSLYWLFVIASASLAIGFQSRLSSVIVFLGLNSLNQRNPLILHGGDTFLRSAGFFLMFAKSGAALSFDACRSSRYLRNSPSLTPKIQPWAQRLIQYQLAVVYLASFWWKMKGATWRGGTALYYVLNLREIQQFPIPAFFYRPWVLTAGTYATMAFELLFPLLVWFAPFRMPLLGAGLLFHLALEYAFNIPMFQWDILSAYVLFLDGDVVEQTLMRLGILPTLTKSRLNCKRNAATAP